MREELKALKGGKKSKKQSITDMQRKKIGIYDRPDIRMIVCRSDKCIYYTWASVPESKIIQFLL